MIYCVIPRELEDELFDKMVDYYADNPDVAVIVDRRDGANRRSGKSYGGQREVRDRRGDRAVEAAKAAFEEWRLVPAPERSLVLLRFARLLEEAKDELTELMTHEMGKVWAEAGGDVQEAIDMSIYMAGEGRRMFGHTTPSELRDKFNMRVRLPLA